MRGTYLVLDFELGEVDWWRGFGAHDACVAGEMGEEGETGWHVMSGIYSRCCECVSVCNWRTIISISKFGKTYRINLPDIPFKIPETLTTIYLPTCTCLTKSLNPSRSIFPPLETFIFSNTAHDSQFQVSFFIPQHLITRTCSS